ncbi:hypothetical protein C9374_002707 [Naegleria lovaniensis]|uniref:Uncharacterized protein n=1 Tax=Naegleria lovaniensis TaxID=51637 RepID=A0AA88KMA2_NAELO|nr:uncharacterized protein C9374_002707 [Naegleria lovaniensis]KAG2386261.1 hypothetical protein C9374_002707 [Naegleria lovaniensis]
MIKSSYRSPFTCTNTAHPLNPFERSFISRFTGNYSSCCHDDVQTPLMNNDDEYNNFHNGICRDNAHSPTRSLRYHHHHRQQQLTKYHHPTNPTTNTTTLHHSHLMNTNHHQNHHRRVFFNGVTKRRRPKALCFTPSSFGPLNASNTTTLSNFEEVPKRSVHSFSRRHRNMNHRPQHHRSCSPHEFPSHHGMTRFQQFGNSNALPDSETTTSGSTRTLLSSPDLMSQQSPLITPTTTKTQFLYLVPNAPPATTPTTPMTPNSPTHLPPSLDTTPPSVMMAPHNNNDFIIDNYHHSLVRHIHPKPELNISKNSSLPFNRSASPSTVIHNHYSNTSPFSPFSDFMEWNLDMSGSMFDIIVSSNDVHDDEHDHESGIGEQDDHHSTILLSSNNSDHGVL